ITQIHIRVVLTSIIVADHPSQRPHELLDQVVKERLSVCSIEAVHYSALASEVNAFFSLF
ncbi:hypothetical protein QQM79_17200, partial [Marinobacteraceae bacterium S3BR75-40.1]